MKQNLEGLDTFNASLAALFQGLTSYGKDAEQFRASVLLFNMVLGDYPAEKAQNALVIWAKNNTTYPTPADIVQLIERNGRPPLDRTTYANLCKIDPYSRKQADWDYIGDYEYFQQHGRHRPKL